MSDACVPHVSATVLEGYVENDATRRRPKPTRIYFVAFDSPFSFGAWREGNMLEDIDAKGCQQAAGVAST